MAFHNPKGRANYEPNSWGAGPRESPERGFRSLPVEESGQKLRARPELFADHYSQAGQFYRSQTDIEQTHIKDALVFELSKVEEPAIRTRMVAHLQNINGKLAKLVADGLGMQDMPKPAEPARAVKKDLAPSPALSILRNGPKGFAGRKLGVLVSDGADAAVLAALKKAAKEEGALVELVAPTVGGVITSDGKRVATKQKVNGGPSVLYDAIAVVVSPQGAELLSREATARDFISDAFAHAKFIARTEAAKPLFDKAGVTDMDNGIVALKNTADASAFLKACDALRFWEREAKVHAV